MSQEEENGTQEESGEIVQEEPGEVEQEQGSLENVEVPEMGRPSFADVAAARAAAVAERAGGVARGLLGGIGARLGEPVVPEDDLSDLFEGPDMDRDNDVYIKDLVTVDEEDVFGEGGGDMSDLLEVTDEDIMGTEDVQGDGWSPAAPRQVVVRHPLRSIPPTGGLSGLQM